MKKVLAASLLMFIIAILPLNIAAQGQHPFDDVPENAWYAEAVEYCYRNELISGTFENKFSPDTGLTRSMFVTMLSRLAKVDTSAYTESSFTDVEAGSWYASSVEWAYKNNITTGTGNGKFSPNEPITREQLCRFFNNFIKTTDAEVITDSTVLDKYIDKDEISSWAKEDVEFAVANSLINSTSSKEFVVSPGVIVTRAQAAQFFMNFKNRFYSIYPLDSQAELDNRCRLNADIGTETTLNLVWEGDNTEISLDDGNTVTLIQGKRYNLIFTRTDSLNIAYSVIEEQTWDLTFDVNGGALDSETSYSFKNGEEYLTVIGEMPQPTLKGHTFEYWYCESKDIVFDINDSFDFEEDITFTAVWKTNTYKISFDPMGASMTDETVYFIEFGQKWNAALSKAPKADLEGYTFEYWYCEKYNYILDLSSDIYYAVDEDITFVAVWKPITYTVTFENGEKYSVDYNQNFGDVITEVPTITREGYTFESWYCESRDYTLSLSDTYTFTENIEFKAIWNSNIYTITFDANGGEMRDRSEYTIAYGRKMNEVISLIPNVNLKGHTFEGWYCEEKNYTLYLSDTYTFTENITFTAVWKPVTYTVTFDPNGGEMIDSSKYTIEYGEKWSSVFEKEPEVKLYAYTLVYWYCEDKGFILDISDTFEYEEDIVFKAVWAPKKPDYLSYDTALEIVSEYQSNMLELFAPEESDKETIDIILFAGQSNSSGRATIDEVTSNENYLTIDESKAFTFNNNKSKVPVKIEEPINGNGTDGKYYGYIPAILNSYYDATGRRVCACFKSVGGMMLNKFLPYTIDEDGIEVDEEQKYYKEMVEYINYAKKNLKANGYEVGNIFMVWCQGEADAAYYGYENEYANVIEQSITDYNEKVEYYKETFDRMFESLQEDTGLEKAFFVRIGHSNKSEECLRNQCIIDAHSQLCRENEDYIMVSTLFAGAKTFRTADGSEVNLMRDASHYILDGYLMAGKEAGMNMAIYVNSKFTVKPMLLEYHALYLETQGVFDEREYDYEYQKYIYAPYL